MFKPPDAPRHFIGKGEANVGFEVSLSMMIAAKWARRSHPVLIASALATAADSADLIALSNPAASAALSPAAVMPR